MAVKTDEIRSTDDLVVSPAKELMTGGHAWDTDKVYTQGVLVTLGTELFMSKIPSIGISPVAGTTSAEWEFEDVGVKSKKFGSSGHIAYKSGFQICWGSAPANNWEYFDRAFSDTPVVIITDGDSTTAAVVDVFKTDHRTSPTKFVAVAATDDGGGATKYVAIGRGA